MTLRMGQQARIGWRLSVNRLLEPLEFVSLGIVTGNLATQDRVVGSSPLVDHDETVHVTTVEQVTVGPTFQVEHHEVRTLGWPLVRTGGNVGNVAGFVGCDADDPLVLDRDLHLASLP